jgi:hypothetical protein
MAATLPPPPPAAGSSPDEPAPSPLSPPSALPPRDHIAPPPARPRTLTNGWRLTLALGWAGILAALGLIANTGFILGSEPFWFSIPVLPFLLPVAVLAALAYDWRHTLLLSFVAAISLSVVAIVDIFHARAMGVAEAFLAFSALALTFAGLAGRVRDEPATADVSEPLSVSEAAASSGLPEAGATA